MEKKVKLVIDEKEVIVDEGITVLDAARQNGITIPTLCHHPPCPPGEDVECVR